MTSAHLEEGLAEKIVETSHSKREEKTLPVTIKNDLTEGDILNIVNNLRDRSFAALVLFGGFDTDLIKISPLTISKNDSGFEIKSKICFVDPIGPAACTKSKIEPDYMAVHSKDIALSISKLELNSEEVKKDIEKSVEFLECAANLAYKWRGQQVDEHFILNSGILKKNLELYKSKEILEKHGELLGPYKVVHAESSRDAKRLSDDLIPLYVEYDRWDLFGTNKVYRYLPRSLVMKLLKCNETSFLPEDLFDQEERIVLNDLVARKHLKSCKIAGKVHYSGLNEKTKRHFLSMFRQK